MVAGERYGVAMIATGGCGGEGRRTSQVQVHQKRRCGEMGKK